MPFHKRIACSNFIGLRIAIVGRSAFEDIANVDIFTLEIDRLDDLREQLSRTTDEGQALLIFVLAGSFSHEHKFSVRIAGTENDVRTFRGKLAALAISDVGANRLE